VVAVRSESFPRYVDCGAHRVGAGVPVVGEHPAYCRALQMPTSQLVIEVEAVERTDAHKIRVEIRERESG
jgi:hypothetical protein